MSAAGPIQRYAAHAQTAPGANTDIMSADLSVLPGMAHVRVTVSLATGSVFNMTITDGTTEYALHLNSGTALTASCLYSFDVPLSTKSSAGTKTYSYNFQVATDGIIQHIEVWELKEIAA